MADASAWDETDFVGAGLRFENEAAGVLMATTALFPGGAETLVLGCKQRNGDPQGRDADAGLARRARGELRRAEERFGRRRRPMAFPVDWHKAQIAEFAEAVRAGRDPRSSGRTALHVHRLIDALIASSWDGRMLEVA